MAKNAERRVFIAGLFKLIYFFLGKKKTVHGAHDELIPLMALIQTSGNNDFTNAVLYGPDGSSIELK